MENLIFGLRKIIPQSVQSFVRPPYHFLLSGWAALFYGFPSRHLTLIGVTGTKGKTTVVELLHGIFSESGEKIASVSSLRFKIGEKETRNVKKMTMPGRMFLQKFLYEAKKAGCRYVILEVTSEGIKQFRHRFIKFSAAVVTNVAPEHIEAHGSFEKYLRSKLDLFWRLPQDALAVINRDDPHSDRFSASTPARKVYYGKSGIFSGDKEWKIKDIEISERGIRFDLAGQDITSGLLGEFNFYNILAAAATGLSFHIAPEKITQAVSKISIIPGRMEFLQKEPFAVVVDYAHTPDSLKNAYAFLRKNLKPIRRDVRTSGVEANLSGGEVRQGRQNSKLICVLGAAGGGRDKWKRPEFGKIAAEFCDEIILTDEDPYDENPQSIIDEIAGGILQTQNPSFIAQEVIVRGLQFKTQNLRKILDRREAIRQALTIAEEGDTVVITGKGAESWMMISGDRKIPWDDREVVKEEIEKLRK
jgi:UDP-N-acetylmuramoyl-L-alanyl-D-glutamate--2,6-diaminopimelate ligase